MSELSRLRQVVGAFLADNAEHNTVDEHEYVLNGIMKIISDELTVIPSVDPTEQRKSLESYLMEAMDSDHLIFSTRVLLVPAIRLWHANELKRTSDELKESIEIMREIAMLAMKKNHEGILVLLSDYQEKINK